jgi:hypothetical protein
VDETPRTAGGVWTLADAERSGCERVTPPAALLLVLGEKAAQREAAAVLAEKAELAAALERL